MKNGIITIIIFTIILIVFYLTGEVYISNSSIDIHIHDTYFCIELLDNYNWYHFIMIHCI